MSDYVSGRQEDLRKRLDCLCWMHNEPAVYIADYFAELKRQVDLDTEQLLIAVHSVKRDTGKAKKDSDLNHTRLTLIGILDELKERTGNQEKPQTSASQVYAFLEQRVKAFKDSSRSLDDLEDSYDQLVREITDESNRVEKCLLGEQTIIYWPHRYNRSELGSLVYFGDLYLNKLEIDCLRSRRFNDEETCKHETSICSFTLPYDRSKAKQVIERLAKNVSYRFDRASKFFYIGKTEQEYSGYSAEGHKVDREFVSYQYGENNHTFKASGIAGLDTSANLFDIYSSRSCRLEIENLRMESLHVNLLPSPVTRLTSLALTDVHFDQSFDTDLLATCTSLVALELQATFSMGVRFDIAFLRALTKLERLELIAPLSSSDLNVFGEQVHLSYLHLEDSICCADKLPKLSKAALEQILSLPRLTTLELSCLDVEAIDREMLSGCKQLQTLDLSECNVARVAENACWNLGFPLSIEKPKEEANEITQEVLYGFGLELNDCDIRTLNAENFAGMKGLAALALTNNSIVDLPPGVFDDLTALGRLELAENRIRRIRSGVFDKLNKLWRLYLGYNPIESIEANAFVQLNNLMELSFFECQLKSIDSEMFIGLQSLKKLHLCGNQIERIEVVAEDGRRRINVAKANLSEDEKQLIKKHLFKGLSGLDDLNLFGNKLKKLDLNCFSNLERLQMLNLSSNEINELSGVVGSELLSNLKTLWLNDNQLSSIDQRSLPKNLIELGLSENKLERLDDDFFSGFTKLSEVNLSQNELTWTITHATFASCRRSLGEINLSRNESISFAEGAFQEMPFLRCTGFDFNEHAFNLPHYNRLRIRKLTPEVLQAFETINFDELTTCCLSKCAIKSLRRESDCETPETDKRFNLSWLVKASQLEELDFSGNLIETLDDPTLFADFKCINSINLSCNRLSCINRDIFKSLSSLETIDLSGNQLSCIDMGLFRQLTCLKHLDLSSNNISFFNLARLFRICPRFESLNLTNNQLDDRSTAEPIDPRTCCSLKALDLANNRLETMNFVRDMIYLIHLDLRGNRIDSVMSNGENMIGRLNGLLHLDLSGNQIGSLRDEMFAHLRFNLVFLDLSGNPADFKLDSVLLELI